MGYESAEPGLAKNVLIAEGALVIGDVEIGEDSGVWFNAVVRGDLDRCIIGRGSNIQDCAVLHCAPGLPVIIGNGVSIGHGAIIHSAVIGDDTLVGMGSIIMDGARIGSGCIIGAGAIVTGGSVIPDGSVVMGSPAKVRRAVTMDDLDAIKHTALEYIDLARLYRDGSARILYADYT